MCGIAGSIDLCISEQALNQLHHRGPDGQAIESFKLGNHKIWLAHTRLSILDLSPAGKQPMQSKDGRWWVTFNGEIYNHLDLRKTLPGPFCGHSDTETLVELIAQQGFDKTLPLLNGMFAFAALDTQEGKIFLARDPFGIKPLYYTEYNKSFAFSSEVRVLKLLNTVNNGIDTDSVKLFLTLRYTPSPKTLWNGIKRLAPGHSICIDISTSKQEIKYYAKQNTNSFTGSLNEAVDHYREQLQAAINRQLLSDVPVGMLLSGGIDSALIAAIAKDLGKELPCFTVGFGQNHPECEIADASDTARILGLPINPIEITPNQLLQALPSIVNNIEEPLGTTSIMPMAYLVKNARDNVTVVLTGQGTDEPWGGYRRYQVEMAHRILPWNRFWHTLNKLSKRFGRIPEVIERGLRTLPVSNMASRYVEACTLFTNTERSSLVGSSFDGGAEEITQYWLNMMANKNYDAAEKMMRMDARMNLADDLLLYGDKQSMAVSLEARVPMLDIELVNFVESLPLKYRIALFRTKIVHKLMAERYLPPEIVHRKKKGFAVPFSAWSRGPWKSFIEEMLLNSQAPHWEILNRNAVQQLWKQHLKKAPDKSRQIFSLLMLALWWKTQ